MQNTSVDLAVPQLFIDDRWIADSAFVTRVWHQPRRYPEPVLTAEHPWETWCPVTYGTVLHQEGRFRMWYCGWTRRHPPRVCYADSDDGIRWEKPDLGLWEFDGRRDNNIVLASAAERGLIDDISVIDDPEDTAWPLKALFYDLPDDRDAAGIYAARSKDGLHWERLPGPVLKWGDRFNAVSSRIDGRFVVLGRAPAMGAQGKGRAVYRAESEDLVHWSEPEPVLSRDAEDPPAMEYYSATAFPYADILMGSIERMHMSPDKLDTELIWSYDNGRCWQRARTRPSFIPWSPERAWDDTWVNLPTNGPILFENRLWFYYSGRSGAHQAPYPLNQGGIGLALLRIDGFASLQATERKGFVLTKPLCWPGGDLMLNIDTRLDEHAHPGFCHGDAAVEVIDEGGTPIPGFSGEDAVPLCTNTARAEAARTVYRWREDSSLDALRGQRIKLRFQLRQAHLYSFCAAEK